MENAEEIVLRALDGKTYRFVPSKVPPVTVPDILESLGDAMI